jgi:uncharacterized RDD family membrane protein YckC
VVAGNLAAAPQRQPVRRTVETIQPPPAPAAPQSPQLSFFPEGHRTRQVSKIIPFESRGVAVPEPPVRKPAERSVARPAQPRQAPASRKNSMQGEFDLLPSAPIAPRTLKTKVEASIYCDAQVATVPHRVLAGATDLSIIVLGYVLCVAAYCITGGSLPSGKLGYLMFGAGFLLVALFYGFLWAAGNAETPGMHWMKLKLTNFDGQEPELSQRLLRYFGTCLSVATCGCGLLWAMVDEENLTWQDHMSKTFPTFQRPETNFCKAR